MAVTKTDIWNAFRRKGGWRTLEIQAANNQLSVSTIRYWEKMGWIDRENADGETKVSLTDAGIKNLESGVQARIANHPTEKKALRFFPKRLAVLAVMAILLAACAAAPVSSPPDEGESQPKGKTPYYLEPYA